MKHLVFPTVADANAFIADLQSQNVVESVTGQTAFTRRNAVAAPPPAVTDQEVVTTEVTDGGGDGKDMAAGALKGGAIGTAVGIAAGAVVAATGGLAAIPVVLGLGVGAAAGMADGAVHGHGLDDDSVVRRYEDSYTLEDDHYDRMSTALGTAGRAVAVEDNIPADLVEATAARHNGRFVS